MNLYKGECWNPKDSTKLVLFCHKSIFQNSSQLYLIKQLTSYLLNIECLYVGQLDSTKWIPSINMKVCAKNISC